MIKKRVYNFLILEVLIAFLLVSMTILPFTSLPFKSFQKELFLLEQIAATPYFTEAFIESLDQIDKENIVLNDIMVPFGKNSKLLIKRSATVKITPPNEKTTYSLITINVTLTTKNGKHKREKNYAVNRKSKLNAG
jgi:hypothetical protein